MFCHQAPASGLRCGQGLRLSAGGLTFFWTSPARYPAGSGVSVSVMLRQPHGFEGLVPLLIKAAMHDAPVTDRPHHGRAQRRYAHSTQPHGPSPFTRERSLGQSQPMSTRRRIPPMLRTHPAICHARAHCVAACERRRRHRHGRHGGVGVTRARGCWSRAADRGFTGAANWSRQRRLNAVVPRPRLSGKRLFRFRQTHGFEGFRMIPEVLDGDDLALAHRTDVRPL